MARLEWIEDRLRNWARCKLMRGSGVLGYAAVNLEEAGTAREAYADVPVPANEIEAAETEQAVRALPQELQRTVLSVYLGAGGLQRKLGTLGISEATLHRHVERAHHLMAGWFTALQAERRIARERVEALQASVRP